MVGLDPFVSASISSKRSLDYSLIFSAHKYSSAVERDVQQWHRISVESPNKTDISAFNFLPYDNLKHK